MRVRALLLFATLTGPAAAGAPAKVEPRASGNRGLTHVVVRDDTVASPADGVYGRLDGDFSAALGLGARAGGAHEPLAPSAQATLYYYWTLGFYLKYADRVSDVAQADVQRSFGAGFELRPAFLLRWSRDLERGPAFWDLTLDSLHAVVGLGRQEFGGGASALGPEFGLGVGVPLFSHAQGPWLEARGTLLAAQDSTHTPSVCLTLAWHLSFTSALVDE